MKKPDPHAKPPAAPTEPPSDAMMLARAALVGLAAAALIAAALAPVAWYTPNLVTHFVLRAALAFGIAWLMFLVVQRTAQFVGGPVTALAVTLTALVLLSHHALYAVQGHPNSPTQIGWAQWFHPATLLGMNLTAIGGIIGAVFYCKDG